MVTRRVAAPRRRHASIRALVNTISRIYNFYLYRVISSFSAGMNDLTLKLGDRRSLTAGGRHKVPQARSEYRPGVSRASELPNLILSDRTESNRRDS